MIKNFALRKNAEHQFYIMEQIYTDIIGKFTMSKIVTDLWACTYYSYKRNSYSSINGFRICK